MGVEEKHQDDLAQSRKCREDNLTRHNRRMIVLGMQHQHETSDMALRQRNEVNALSRVNDEKQATQAANMVVLKGRNQEKRDDLCRLMCQTEALEAQMQVETVRYFGLAERVKQERPAMRKYAELQHVTEMQLSAQMGRIRAIQEELAVGRSNNAAAKQTTNSLKELRRRLNAVLSDQENRARRVSRQVSAIAKINKTLLEKHQR